MSEVALDFPKIKNGNGHSGRPHERKLTADLRKWLTDLDATEALRRQQLREISELRAEIYRHAGARGVSPTMLRVASKMLRK